MTIPLKEFAQATWYEYGTKECMFRSKINLFFSDYLKSPVGMYKTVLEEIRDFRIYLN